MEPTWGQYGLTGANLGPIWGQLEPTWANLGPTWGQLGANLGQLEANRSQQKPTCSNLGLTWGQHGPTWLRRANLGSTCTLPNLKINVSPRPEHDFYEIVRFTVDTLWKALGMPWEVLGTPWVDVWLWGHLGRLWVHLGGPSWRTLEKPWQNLLEDPPQSTSNPEGPKVNLLLDGELRSDPL